MQFTYSLIRVIDTALNYLVWLGVDKRFQHLQMKVNLVVYSHSSVNFFKVIMDGLFNIRHYM